MGLDQVQGAIIRCDHDPVRPLDLGLRQDALNRAVRVDTIDGVHAGLLGGWVEYGLIVQEGTSKAVDGPLDGGVEYGPTQ